MTDRDTNGEIEESLKIANAINTRVSCIYNSIIQACIEDMKKSPLGEEVDFHIISFLYTLGASLLGRADSILAALEHALDVPLPAQIRKDFDSLIANRRKGEERVVFENYLKSLDKPEEKKEEAK